MSDLIGKTLGSYRILEPIGVGGMATVYKAYQPGMDRLVAIKVLPPHLLQDEQFAKRFQREAQAITWLEHPHILPIYDYGEVEGITYLAMRYVDAGTLKQRIAKGPLPLDEVSRIIGQIGDALDYAHRMGIIHRDVKPANVLMDDRGNTYLTDFGLARMMETSDQLTASGVGVGTPAYMSPEQGQGVKVDHRSDIYSLGVVLYEMVTGHVPFEAETPMAVVLKHISEPLPLPRTVAPCVPEPVERIILKALAKDPAHRYQTAGEMVQALTIAVRKVTPEALQQPVEGELGIGELGKGREDTSLVTRIQRTWQQPRGKVMLIGGAIIVAALVVLLSQLPGQVQIVSETVPTVAPDATATSAAVAVAPTQKPTTAPVSAPVAATAPTKPCRILSVDQQEGYLFAQDCDGSNWRKLTDPPVWVQWPSWSPDGQRIVFESNPSKPVPGPNPTSLYIVNADGSGLTRLITARGGVYQSSWSPDGSRIAFAQDCNLFTIGPDGSNRVMLVDSQKLSRAGDSELCTHAPMWSSDSRRISFTAFFPQDSSPGPYEHRIYLVNADGSGLTELLSFKMKDRTPPGTHALWSPDGNQVAFAYEVEGKYKSYLMNVDGSGKPEEIESIPDSWSPTHWPQWDRDVQTAAATLAPAQPCRNLYEDQEKEYDLFVRDCDGSHTRRLTEHRTFGHSFSWSPDGQRIIFDATFGSKPPPTSIYIINADGSNRTQLLTGGEGGFGNPSWSPNGERIAYMERCNIMTIRLDGSDMVTIVQRQDLMNHKGDPDMCLWEPVWSPDSRRIALTAQELNPPPNAPSARRVAVVNADGTGLIDVAAFDLNQQGGVRPVCWSPDGQQIAYLVWDGQVAKRYLVNADGSGKSAEIDSIPEAWCPTHWPQWDRTPQAPPVGTQAEQARAFAEPILNAIANRPPDYQDDFSDPKSGWPSGSTPGGDKWGYEDNAYFFSATYRPQGGCCGAAPARALAFSDFILEVDGQFISGERSSWYVILRHTDNAQYGMGLSLDGDLRMWKNVQGVHQDLGGTHLANFEKGEGVNHLVVIARGSQIAIYVNGRPAWFVYDESSSRGEMSLGVGNEAHGTTLRVRFDNFKVWDISKPPTTAKAHPMDLSVDSTAGCRVKINGVLRPAEGPWSWDWGDGTETVGYFPQEHTFLKSGAYTVRVTASNGISDALSLKLACP